MKKVKRSSLLMCWSAYIKTSKSYWYSNDRRLTNHSIASSRPSPFVADVLKIAHVLLFSAESPKAVEISEGLMAPCKS